MSTAQRYESVCNNLPEYIDRPLWDLLRFVSGPCNNYWKPNSDQLSSTKFNKGVLGTPCIGGISQFSLHSGDLRVPSINEWERFNCTASALVFFRPLYKTCQNEFSNSSVIFNLTCSSIKHFKPHLFFISSFNQTQSYLEFSSCVVL